MSFKFKGRSFSSARSLASAMEREMKAVVERQIRQSASGAGAQVTRKANGDLEIKGTADQLNRFNRRLTK